MADEGLSQLNEAEFLSFRNRANRVRTPQIMQAASLRAVSSTPFALLQRDYPKALDFAAAHPAFHLVMFLSNSRVFLANPQTCLRAIEWSFRQQSSSQDLSLQSRSISSNVLVRRISPSAGLYDGRFTNPAHFSTSNGLSICDPHLGQVVILITRFQFHIA